MDTLQLPIFVSYLWTLLVFGGFWLLFYITLVRLWPLGKIGWKRVDYAWLLLALVGVSGVLGSARQILVSSKLSIASARLETQAGSVIDRIRFGTSAAVCRTFVRSELSPPAADFERGQREFDAMCAWFTEATRRSAAGVPQGVPLSMDGLGGSPPPSGADQWPVESLKVEVERYNEALSSYQHLVSEGKQSDTELSIAVLSPFLISIAIALRMTKVAGEIRLERGLNRGAV